MRNDEHGMNMEPLYALSPFCIATSLVAALLLLCRHGASAATFTLANECAYTVWPGILSNAGSSLLANGGFELGPGQSVTIQAPSGWSGRLWGRTGCEFSASGMGRCASGDCGGKLQCEGTGAATPTTLAEFTIAGAQPNVKQDFYDVSLVDGYNLPIAVVPRSGSGTCGTAGCARDLNMNCPAALQVVADDGGRSSSTAVVGCKSACDAFGDPQYCCSGAYANPSTCRPSTYSQMFKSACPKAYSYAFDDPTSTFTCTKADYSILFCPTSASQKSVTGLEQPEGDLVGTQVYATSSSSEGQLSATSPGLLILVAAYLASILARVW